MPDNSRVICPSCSHQFRAVPINEQSHIKSIEMEVARLRGILETSRRTLGDMYMLVEARMPGVFGDTMGDDYAYPELTTEDMAKKLFEALEEIKHPMQSNYHHP